MANNTSFTSGRDLNSVSENVELLTGQRGNQLDKAVTYRDLESLGVATLSRIGSNYKATANPTLIATSSAVDFPAKPLNVAANGAFNTILIDWDEPNYRGHSYAEVWRAETDNLSVAVKIGTSSANMYSDPIGGSAKVYYWVRFVNQKKDEGPYNSSAGTYAETAENIQNILAALQGQIEESHLAQSLLSNIELIPALNTSIKQIPLLDVSIQEKAAEIQLITVDLSSLTERQSQAEAILKAAQDLLGSTTIDVSLLHDELSKKVLQYGSDVQSLRNAILSIDPATGEITIDAINVVRSELQTNIDQVTQRISSVEGTLTQKASSVDVGLQAQRILTVETRMSSINAELTNQVTRAEFTETTEDVTQLTTRMSAAEGSITQKATQQSVDQLGTRVATAESVLIAVNEDLQSKATQIIQIDSSYKSADAANAAATSANTAAITELSQSVSTANSATSTHLSSLDTSVSGLNSSVTQLQQATSTNTETSASIYDQLKAKTDISAIAAASAALSEDETTRQRRYSEASIKHDLTVLTNDHESLAQSVEEFKADFETETAAISAQIANEKTARTTAVESLAQVVSTIDASYKSADVTTNARIATEETARASADSALSTRVDQVLATTNNNTAAIQSEQTARTSADNALAQQINSVQASVNSNISAIKTEQTARATADEALSSDIETLFSSVGNNTAAIQNEASTRASANESLSTQISTVQATANSKNKIYLQSSAPTTGLTVGDIWYDSDDSNKSYRWSGSSWVSVTDVRIAQNVSSIQSEATARASADTALSSRIDTVQATANNLTASAQTQSQAISTLENGAQAMWTAKTQVGQITAGIGVMTDSNGKSQVMISASQLFVFDPNSAAPTQSLFAVSDGKVVIQKAVIEKATIETVTAMKLTADYVKAGVSITSPAINGGTLSIGSGDNSIFLADGAIGIGKGGPYGGWGFGWHTIIYSDGGLYTDRLHASSGDFTGYVRATSGYMTNVTIAENCNVLGTIYANKIVGDVVAIKNYNITALRAVMATTLLSGTIISSTQNRILMLSDIRINSFSTVNKKLQVSIYVDGVQVWNGKAGSSTDASYTANPPPLSIASGANRTFSVSVYTSDNSYLDIPAQDIQCTVVPASSGTFA